MTKVMAAHQPNFLPYLGFFEKMAQIEELGDETGVFIIRDDAQFVKRDFHNRNRIRTNSGKCWSWLHIPVNVKGSDRVPLYEVSIAHDKRVARNEFWTKHHIRMIKQCYARTPFFGDFFPEIERIYSDPGESLSHFNMMLINHIAASAGLKVEIVMATDLSSGVHQANSSETLAAMSREVGADLYLSGDGARITPDGHGYLNEDVFKDDKEPIQVTYQNYVHPVYPQQFPGFKKYMSAIDALFTVGRLPRSGEVLVDASSSAPDPRD